MVGERKMLEVTGGGKEVREEEEGEERGGEGRRACGERNEIGKRRRTDMERRIGNRGMEGESSEVSHSVGQVCERDGRKDGKGGGKQK